jgi:hypothetical protein
MLTIAINLLRIRLSVVSCIRDPLPFSPPSSRSFLLLAEFDDDDGQVPMPQTDREDIASTG